MNLIPTRVHGVLDYAVGLLLIVAPWLFGFAHHGIATWLPVILGASALVYSLFTRYELALIKAIPLPAHLTLDGISGLLLAASQWIFGFSHIVKWPHVIIGLFEIAAALSTQRVPHLSEHEEHGHRIAHA